MAQNGITYVLNASNTCPKPDFISEGHFMRIPVNDNYCEKLLPWLDKTNEFIGKMRRRPVLFDPNVVALTGCFDNNSSRYSTSVLMTPPPSLSPCVLSGNVSLL